MTENMTNERLLDWLNGVEAVMRGDSMFAAIDAEALAQLRAMLQEPTDEGRKEMGEFLRLVRAMGGFDITKQSWWTQKEQDMFDKVNRLISAPKPKATIPKCIECGWAREDDDGDFCRYRKNNKWGRMSIDIDKIPPIYCPLRSIGVIVEEEADAKTID